MMRPLLRWPTALSFPLPLLLLLLRLCLVHDHHLHHYLLLLLLPFFSPPRGLIAPRCSIYEQAC
jgi:hypothetical protein